MAAPWRAGRAARALATGRWLIAVALLVAACAGGAIGSANPEIKESGFPTGTYVKAFVEPTLGPSTLAWTFGPDGRWAEIPLDGAPVGAKPIRGAYRVEGDQLTITTNYPPGFGSSRHSWRLEGGNLWTTFMSSDLEGDADWFAMLDPVPWTPLR